MFVIAGVSGNTGSVVAETLLDQKQKVRVLVRDAAKGAKWKERGAEVVVGSLDDAGVLTEAFKGARGAYVLSPPAFGSKDFIGDRKKTFVAISEAVKASKLPHVVLLSSIGAHLDGATGPIRTAHNGEKVLSASTALTAVRASYFMENLGGSLSTVGDGKLFTFLRPDMVIPMVATRDIGRAAARALVEGPQGFEKIELAGPRDYSANDAAGVISSIIGRPVAAIGAPEEGIVPTFTGFGMSPEFAELFREMLHGMNTGAIKPEAGNKSVRGDTPLEAVLRPMLGK